MSLDPFPLLVIRKVEWSADTIIKIPKAEAALLPNKTWPIANEPGYYLASLDVFHQLHCLVGSGSFACLPRANPSCIFPEPHSACPPQGLLWGRLSVGPRPHFPLRRFHSPILDVRTILSVSLIWTYSHRIAGTPSRCNADISVNVWQWDKNLSAVVGHSSQAHSCRNFDKLLDWTLERQLEDWIDIRLYVEDDLPSPPIISA